MSAETDVVAAFFRCRRGAVAVDDADIEKIVSIQEEDRVCKYGVNAPARVPIPKHSIHARVVDFLVGLLHPFRSAAPSTDIPCKAIAKCN